jgi:outer membrane protein assembly factor BamB
VRTKTPLPLLLLATLHAGSGAPAADWPEWRGEGRRGVWTESGILERFPETGLMFSWKTPIGEGYAGPAVAAGRVFVTDFQRSEGIRGTERALALDERSGQILWKHEWPVDYAGTQPAWASGPRATPTVDRERVHVVGTMGRLACLEAATGKLVWQRDLVADYGATVPNWGVASSPLVWGELLITLVGGKNGATVVAFDVKTGAERWRALSAEGDPGYASPILVRAGDREQVVVWHPLAIHGLDPRDGRVLWSHPFEVSMAMTVATPVFDRDRLLVSAFFDGSVMLRLSAEKAELLWQQRGKNEEPAETRALHALITTPVLDGGHVYGIDSYGELRGLDAASGERLWESLDLVGEKARWASGMIVRNGDRYLVNTDRGDLVLARLTPQGYAELDRTQLIEPTSKGGGQRERGAVLWSHPAYANRHVVVRNDREIVRASLALPFGG